MVNEVNQSVATEIYVPKSSFVEMVKEMVQPEYIAQKIGVEKHTLIDVCIYGTIGFIFVFLLKKYSEYFIACALFIVCLMLMHHFDIISLSINTAKIDEYLGIPLTPNGEYGTLFITWAKSNVAAAATLAISFLIGMKVG
jgi:uncharacterized membrane protein (Fun14 family)